MAFLNEVRVVILVHSNDLVDLWHETVPFEIVHSRLTSFSWFHRFNIEEIGPSKFLGHV